MTQEKTTIFISQPHPDSDFCSKILSYLTSCHDFIEVIDKTTSDDNFVSKITAPLKETKSGFGIIICETNNLACIEANRTKGIRAIVAETPESAKSGREESNANLLCLSSKTLDLEATKRILYDFFHTKFLNNPTFKKHINRLNEGDYA